MLLILALAACTGSPPDLPDDDTGIPDTADTDTDTDSGTEAPDTGTDEDGDGWTVEEGDCADDEVWQNPGLPERPDDDLDNDCDGRVDEVFDGVLVVQAHLQGAETTAVHGIDPLGDVDSTWSLAGTTAQAQPRWLDERLDRDGWMATDPAALSVLRIDPDGDASLTWSATADTGLADDDVPEALWGVASHPDGWTAVTSGPALYRIDDDGTATVLARWTALEAGHRIYASALTADPLTGAITLFGYFGGVATWTAGDGLEVVVQEDPDAPTGQFLDARSDEQGTAFVLGSTATDGTGVFAWDGATLELVGPWVDSGGDPIDFTPVALALDTEGGDFYVSANGGWKRTVWRVFGDDGFASPLYPDPDTLDDTPGSADEFRRFLGLAARWQQDP